MPIFLKFALRDLLLIAATTLLWWAFADATAGPGLVSDLLGLILGLAFGISVFLLHEWGHWLGALWGKSDIQAPASLQSFYLFSCRSLTRSAWRIGLFSNRWLIVGVAVQALAQIAITYLPVMNTIFDTAPLQAEVWLRIFGIAVVVSLVVAAEKWLRARSGMVRRL